MTNLKSVNIGQNKFCGPAVLSILTGKSTDECASVISRINGHYKVTGVLITDLLRALDKLGFDQKHIEPTGSLFRSLSSLVNSDGIYVVMVPGHFVCIEIKDKKIYFCDNHTKEPIPAASSARLSQAVLSIYKVFERVKTEADIAREEFDKLKAERDRAAAYFEMSVEATCLEIIHIAKDISKSLGEVSLDELQNFIIAEFTKRLNDAGQGISKSRR